MKVTTFITSDGKDISACSDCGRIWLEGSDHSKCKEAQDKWLEKECGLCHKKNRECDCDLYEEDEKD